MMFEKQNGLCAICQEREAKHIDHDHITGKIRGLLCRPCNTSLGILGDTEDALMHAIAYLKGEDKNITQSK